MHYTNESPPPPPFYGIDDETQEQYIEPLDEYEAIKQRDAHPRRDHIELWRHPTSSASESRRT